MTTSCIGKVKAPPKSGAGAGAGANADTDKAPKGANAMKMQNRMAMVLLTCAILLMNKWISELTEFGNDMIEI